MASLALSLLLAPPDHAQSGPPGYYSSPTITGGQATAQGNPNPAPYSMNPGTGYYGATATGTGLSCGGQIETKWTWTPRVTGASPPQQVVVKQFCNATWQSSTASGKCGDGLGDAAVPAQGGGGATSSGTHYSMVQADAKGNVTLDCSPSASVSSGSCGVSYQPALISPVTIALGGGAVQDSSGNYDILVGQPCSASLSSINGCTVSNWQWSVSGTTFQSWTVSSDQSHTTEVDGPGPLTNATASWYWDDSLASGKNNTETVTCTATVTPPAGQGSPFTVTATQNVTVYVPTWSCTGTGGTVYVNTQFGPGNGTDYYLYAGPAVGTSGRGMGWSATVSAPTAPVTFGAGVLQMVQTETPTPTYTSSAGISYKRSNDGQNGLDTSYPYPFPQSSPPTYAGGDSPNFDLTSYSAVSAQLTYSFVDTLMYEPPNSSQYVPLATFSWSTSGNAQLGAGGWASYGTNSAGAVTPSGLQNFTASNSYPSWTQNVGNGTYTWVPAK